jgi:hypothetical protein
VKRFALALLVSLTLFVPAGLAAQALPTKGVLTPGKSLGGLKIGMTMDQVKSLWGSQYKLCPKSDCKGQTVWYYIYARGEPLGAAVRFRNQKVSAVFTLGSPMGWHTTEGLGVGEQIEKANSLYGQLAWHVCIGYGAMSMRTGNTVTSIYTTGVVVYGFAITSPTEAVCQ